MWLSIKTQNSNIHFRCDQFLIRYRTFSGIGMVLLYSLSASQLWNLHVHDTKVVLGYTWCPAHSFTNINFGMSLDPTIRLNVRFILQLLTSKYLVLDRVKNHFFCWLSHLLPFYLKSFILRFVIENSRIDGFFIIYVPCMTLHYWHMSNTSIY